MNPSLAYVLAAIALGCGTPFDPIMLDLTVTDPLGNAAQVVLRESDFSEWAIGVQDADDYDHVGRNYDGRNIPLYADDVYIGLLDNLEVTYYSGEDQYSVFATIDVWAAELWDSDRPCTDENLYSIDVEFAWTDVEPGRYQTRLLHSIRASAWDTDETLCLYGGEPAPSGGYLGYDFLCRNGPDLWRDWATGLMMIAYGVSDGHGLPYGAASTDVPPHGWMALDGAIDAFQPILHYKLSEGDHGTISFDQLVERADQRPCSSSVFN